MSAEETLSLPQEKYLTLKSNSYILDDDPQPIEKYLIAFDQAGAKQIALIYHTYTLLNNTNKELNTEVTDLKTLNETTEQLSNSYKNSLLDCKAIMESIEDDRNFVYSMYEEALKDQNSLARRKKVITIFSAIGGGLAGVGLGIIIGIFVI